MVWLAPTVRSARGVGGGSMRSCAQLNIYSPTPHSLFIASCALVEDNLRVALLPGGDHSRSESAQLHYA